MQGSLFRPEAVEFQQQHRQWGEVVVLQPVSTKVLSWFLITATVVIFVFCCFAPYPRTETVSGYLAPASGTAKIFAAQGGTIQQIYVSQGQRVHQGQPLLTVGTEQIAADGRNIQTEILDVLQSQKNLLLQQISSEEARATSERNRLTALLRGLSAEMATIQAQIAIQHDRVRLAEDLVSSATDLHTKGYLSNLEYNRRRENVLEQKQAIDSFSQQLVKLQNDMIQAESSLDQLPATMGEKIQLLRSELATTEQRISEKNGQRAYTVQSPIDGQVALLAATPGRTADPKAVQMEIVPNDSEIEAQLFVPARAIGFVMPGQKVRLLYDAFPYQEYGTYGGVVTNVSQTMITGPDGSGPLRLEESTYRILASVDRSAIEADRRQIPLQPDMTLKAKIILEQRPVVRWLLDAFSGTGL